MYILRYLSRTNNCCGGHVRLWAELHHPTQHILLLSSTSLIVTFHLYSYDVFTASMKLLGIDLRMVLHIQIRQNRQFLEYDLAKFLHGDRISFILRIHSHEHCFAVRLHIHLYALSNLQFQSYLTNLVSIAFFHGLNVPNVLNYHHDTLFRHVNTLPLHSLNYYYANSCSFKRI